MLPGLSSDELKNLLLSIGTHRGKRSLSPPEAALLFRKAIAAGASTSECAKAVQLEGPTWVARFVKLLDLPSDVLHLVDWGRRSGSVAFTSASEVSRLQDTEDQRRAMEATLKHDLSSSEVRQLVQLRTRSTKGIDQCVAEVLKMRPQVEVRHIFVGAVINDRVQARLRTQTQHERDAYLSRVCREKWPAVKLSGHLGAERFTLVGDKEFGVVVAARKNVLQQQVNDALEGILKE